MAFLTAINTRSDRNIRRLVITRLAVKWCCEAIDCATFMNIDGCHSETPRSEAYGLWWGEPPNIPLSLSMPRSFFFELPPIYFYYFYYTKELGVQEARDKEAFSLAATLPRSLTPYSICITSQTLFQLSRAIMRRFARIGKHGLAAGGLRSSVSECTTLHSLGQAMDMWTRRFIRVWFHAQYWTRSWRSTWDIVTDTECRGQQDILKPLLN